MLAHASLPRKLRLTTKCLRRVPESGFASCADAIASPADAIVSPASDSAPPTDSAAPRPVRAADSGLPPTKALAAKSILDVAAAVAGFSPRVRGDRGLSTDTVLDHALRRPMRACESSRDGF